MAVFVDGCFWHGCLEHATTPKENAEWWRDKLEQNQHRDADTTRELTEAGWLVLRFWEHDDPAASAVTIRDAVLTRTDM